MNFKEDYQAVMNKVEVDPIMRQKILANIESMDLASKRKKHFLSFLPVKDFGLALACLLVLAIGALTLPSVINQFINPDSGDDTATLEVASPIIDVGSAQELSELAQFTVNDIDGLLLIDTNDVTYSYLMGYIAQIQYGSGEDGITFRKAMANEDISGDYTDYEYELVEADNDIQITLKGNQLGVYNLAIWTKENYSYSLSIPSGLDSDTLLSIIKAIE